MYSEHRHHGGWVDFIAPEKRLKPAVQVKRAEELSVRI